MPRKKRQAPDQDVDDDETLIEEETTTRPDVAARLTNRHKLIESCHKSSLGTRLAPDWEPAHRATLLTLLQEQIQSTSEIIVRGSFIVNEVILTCIEHVKGKLPAFNQSFFNTCFLEGLERSKKRSKQDFSIIQAVVKNEFTDYPDITRCRGDIQAITIAAKRYMANFKTALITPFFKRQRAFIKVWLDANNLDKSPYEVQCLVNGWKRPTPRPKNSKKRQKKQPPPVNLDVEPELNAFVEQERELLGKPADLCFVQLGRNYWRTVKYLYHILKYYNEHGVGKGFSLAPVARIKSYFMTVDTTVLFELLKNVASKLGSSCPEWLVPIKTLSCKDVIKGSPEHSFKDVMWRKTFNLDGLRKKMRFNYQVDTDGVSMTSHFVVTKKSRTRRAKRMRYKAKHRNVVKRVISIDPGRTNLITAYDTYTNSYKTLTRAGYRHAVGFAVRQRRAFLRDLPLHGINQSLSCTSMRTCNRLKMYLFRQVIIRNYKRLWALKTSKSRARDLYTTYRKKTQVLDRFFAGLTSRGEPKPVVAYGSASILPTGQGETSVPVKGVLKVCQRHYNTHLVNEYLTTKMHAECHSRMHPVANRSTNESPTNEHKHSVRGLLWCPTCKKFVNRDRNASVNILHVYQNSERPEYLRFGQEAVKMQVMPLLPPTETKSVILVAKRRLNPKNSWSVSNRKTLSFGYPRAVGRVLCSRGDTITKG